MPDLNRPCGRSLRVAPWCLLAIGLTLGYLTGINSSSTAIHADVTEEPRREALKAGDTLNQPLFREMAATLKRIEDQLARIEKKLPAAVKK